MAASKRMTVIFLLVAIAAVIGYDIYAAASTQGATISEIVLAASLKRPAFPFATGFLCGHLFWPQKGA